MKIRKFAAALLALVLCLSLSLPAAFAEAQQRVELKNLTVNVKCTGNAIPDEQLTIRLTPRKKAPMPGDAAALEAFVNTADCTRSNGYMTTATFPETFVFTAPGTYEYEAAQLKGSSLNGTYDTRTMVLRVTVSWSGDTLVAVAKVYDGTFDTIGGQQASLGVADNAVQLPTGADSWRFETFTVEEYESLYQQMVDGTLGVDDDYTVMDNAETATNWSNVNVNII